jgi:hypothetical protein
MSRRLQSVPNNFKNGLFSFAGSPASGKPFSFANSHVSSDGSNESDASSDKQMKPAVVCEQQLEDSLEGQLQVFSPESSSFHSTQ